MGLRCNNCGESVKWEDRDLHGGALCGRHHGFPWIFLLIPIIIFLAWWFY